MTIKELIERLKKFPGDAPFVIVTSEDGSSCTAAVITEDDDETQ